MEMAVYIVGAGFNPPIEGLSFNLAMGSYIAFRRSLNQVPFMIRVQDLFSLGNQTGTFLVSRVEVDWFKLGPENEAKLPAVEWLLCKELQLDVKSSVLVSGKVDIELTVFSDHGYPTTLIKSYGRKAKGFQFGNASVRGKAVRSLVNEKSYADAIKSGVLSAYE